MKCEASKGVYTDQLGKPMVSTCQNPATLIVRVPKTSFTAMVCDDCAAPNLASGKWEKVRKLPGKRK